MTLIQYINRRTNKEEKVTIMFSSHTPTTVCPYHIFEIQQLHINDQQSKKKWKSHEQLNISQAVSVSKQVKQKYLI